MPETLWQPDLDNPMRRFREFVANKTGQYLANYGDLYNFSVAEIERFWELFLEYTAISLRRKPDLILERRTPWRNSIWFPGAEINWAELALKARQHSEKTALFSFDENGLRTKLSYAQLYRSVKAMRDVLDNLHIKPGDRFATFMPNTEETLVTLLAAVSAKATFSSTSPDFGAGAASDRFLQFAPRFLAVTTHYFFKGKKISVLDKIIEIVRRTPSVKILLVFRASDSELILLQKELPEMQIVTATVTASAQGELEFASFSFQDPLYVMYSSGTTGLPKCIVQGHGVILNHIKEHLLHCGLTASETIFYYTTCGWMMYNWLISALCLGATVVLYDGNPFYPDSGFLWRMARDYGVTIFGTSAKYLLTLAQENFDARALTQESKIRTILSTGSVLPPEGFDYVYQKIHPAAQLASISGGTDLNGCWALGNPDLPVNRGELQCRGLGMAVEIWNDEGKAVVDEMGELVCTQPFPSMPLGFLGDESGARYSGSYFERFPGRDVWAHGDFAMLKENGGMVFSGRSDATLNPGGVRIGTAEIYRALDFIPEIEDSLIIGKPIANDEKVVLFVKLRQGNLNEELTQKIKQTIRDKVSPRHVPAEILPVQGIPYTINGKKIELAVKYLAMGRPVSNRETIANPEVLDEYERLLRAL